MNIRPLDRSANRSGVIARRASVVALAAAVVIAPVFAAAPAFADASVVTSVAFPAATVAGGGSAQAYFNGDTTLTQVAGFDACFAEYKNGVVVRTGGSQYAAASAPYDYLVTQGYAPGDTFAVSFFDGDPNVPTCTVAPALGTPGLVSASILLGAPTPPPAPAQELPVSAAPLTLKQGVPFDQNVAITFGAGWDFSAKGGWIAAGPQSSAGLENGEIYPLEGLEFESINENTPGVVPTLRVVGTPKYSGVVESGFQAGDNTSYGFAGLTFTIASANGINGPIQMEAAIGAPVAGSTVTIIAAGLKEGAAWDVTVRSTPVVVGSGTIAFGGQLSQRVTIPAGLAAGSHSITVTSTRADGTPFSAVLYFTVSATGTLLSVSLTAPQLAATGTDLMVPSLVAGGLLVAGLGLAGVSVYRRRNSN
jgi:hypothetical protein